MKYLLVIVFAAPTWAACVPVEADHILGKDLAIARPEFVALDPGLEIGFSPLPGVTRVFHPSDLVALARKFGTGGNNHFESICFVRTAAAVTATRKSSLPDPEVIRGEPVSVVVRSGAALVRFQADAETSGRRGDAVLVRNPENGKLFQARVEAKGKVMIQR